jgi:multidrug efflux pump subunit AcrB
VKLNAGSTKDFDTLKSVAADFEKFLKNLPGTKSVGSSSTETPGQFIFEFDNDKLANIGLKPNDIL